MCYAIADFGLELARLERGSSRRIIIMRYPTREYQTDSSSLPLGRSADCVRTSRAPGWFTSRARAEEGCRNTNQKPSLDSRSFHISTPMIGRSPVTKSVTHIRCIPGCVDRFLSSGLEIR